MSVVLIIGAGAAALFVALGLCSTLFTLFIRRAAQAAVPPLGRFVQVGDTRLHVMERGSGPPLLLVHGLGAQMRNFTYALVDQLAPNFRVICVDRPGCGYSTRPAQVPASLTGQAATIAKLLAELGLEKTLIVGHSYGGAAALALAVNHPDSIGALALVAPLTHAQKEAPAAFRDLVISSKHLRRLIAWTIAVPLSMLTGRRILDLVFRPDSVPADFATAAGGLLALRPGQFFAASSDLVNVGEDLPGIEERYSSIRVPVGILFGKNDQILGYAQHGVAMQSKIPGLVLSLVDGGHMLPLSAPELTARWIAEFAGRSPEFANGRASLSSSV